MRSVSFQELDSLCDRAVASARRRANLNIHSDLRDPYQRFFNAMEPATYVRPHRHPGPQRWELFLVVRGSAAAIELSGDGVVTARTVLDPATGAVAVEIPGDCWHTVVALERGTVVFEVKPGPYHAIDDKDYAAWAPAESDQRASLMLETLRFARVGDCIRPEA